MRRVVFAGLGGLELVIAGVVVYLGLSLPRPREVGDGFDRLDTTTRKASGEIGAMRRQVHELRRPEMQQLADQLQQLSVQAQDQQLAKALADAAQTAGEVTLKHLTDGDLAKWAQNEAAKFDAVRQACSS